MKWDIRTLPFLITGALAIVDLNMFNQNITKPEDCPKVQYACPDCPYGQRCVYPNSGGCEGAGIPTCQATQGCFGIVCLMRALPCPKECPFFCEYKGPPCCPFIGQPVCKPQCKTFAPCKVTKCPEECPDDCFYPNASTCCPKSGQSVCKNKRHQVLTPPPTIKKTSTSDDDPQDDDIKEINLGNVDDSDEIERKKHRFQKRNNGNHRENHQNEIRASSEREDSRYFGPNAVIDSLSPIPENNADGYPEVANDYYPFSLMPDNEDSYDENNANPSSPYDKSTKHPYANDMNDRFIPRIDNDYYHNYELQDENEHPSKDFHAPPPFNDDPTVVTVTESITECEIADSNEQETTTTSSIPRHFCPLFIRACPPECPNTCIYPSDAPCPYTMQPSCPPKEGDHSSEEHLSNDDLSLSLISNSLLGEDIIPSSIADQDEDVKSVVTQPIDIDLENNDRPHKRDIVHV